LFSQNVRCREIAFSGHQNAENEDNETEQLRTEQSVSLKLGIGTFV
jgi:hypothetical protein